MSRTDPGAGGARILLVEDELDIAELIKHALERDGQGAVEIVPAGDTAVRAVAAAPPDLMILDLNLPGLDGVAVCRLVRGRPATANLPILVLSARTAESDRVSVLELGADDYVTKPFSLRELTLRVRTLLRRRAGAAAADAPGVYRGARLIVDFDAIEVIVDGLPVRLSRLEFDLLRCLLENRPRVLSRGRLLDRVWGYDSSVQTRTVDVHVGRLRAKLGAVGAQIETVQGFGYRFNE
jgi:DNA-binding response OmpR family regulator